jgi:hypothetical protein
LADDFRFERALDTALAGGGGAAIGEHAGRMRAWTIWC